MTRRSAGAIILFVAVATGLAGVDPASAAPTRQVVQGDVIRLESIADWGAAAALRPGQPVRWDVTVSADAPDPGVVRVGLSARGDADLIVDAQLCSQAWEEWGCPAAVRTLRSEWQAPKNGVESSLLDIVDTEVAHLRLTVALNDGETGSTEMRVHAQGAGESVAIGPDGGLAATGLSPLLPWMLGGGMLLVVSGLAIGARRAEWRRPGARRGTRRPEGVS